MRARTLIHATAVTLVFAAHSALAQQPTPTSTGAAHPPPPSLSALPPPPPAPSPAAVPSAPASPSPVAQTAAPANDQLQPPPSPQAVSDILIYKNGMSVRGTVYEIDPASHVTITLPNGEQRIIPIGQVLYAGPISRMPPQIAHLGRTAPHSPMAGPPMIPEAAVGPQVRLEANQPGVIYFMRRKSSTEADQAADYAPMCRAPCVGALSPGTYQLALSYAHHKPIPAPEPIRIAGPSTIQGEYSSKRGTRTAGWVILGVGSFVGTAMMVVVLTEHTKCSQDYDVVGCQRNVNTPLVVSGLIVTLASIATGLVLGLQSDSVSIRVVPWTSPAPSVPAAGGLPAGWDNARTFGAVLSAGQGLGVNGRF